MSLACTSNTIQGAKTLFIAPQLADCTGVGPQKCMLIKEGLEDEWTYFYDQIEGFKYEEGFTYELLVNEIQVPNPAADASSIRYELNNIVSKTPTLDNSELINAFFELRTIRCLFSPGKARCAPLLCTFYTPLWVSFSLFHTTFPDFRPPILLNQIIDVE